MKTLSILHEGNRIQIHAVTSDTHFGHRNIAKYAGRPFDNSVDTESMDATLITKWNEVVSPDETVLHLGDAAMGKLEETLLNYESVNGRIALIPGNHDAIASVAKSSASKREKLEPIYRQVFDWILPEKGVVLEAVLDGETRFIQASHYPSWDYDYPPQKVDRFKALRPHRTLGLIVHGHTHSNTVFCEGNTQEFHVGVDAHGMSPVKAEVIVDWVFKQLVGH